MEYNVSSGTWEFSDRITAGQAAHTGVQRAVLDWLVEHGPAAGPEIRKGLPAIKDGVIKNAMARLTGEGWLPGSGDGVWSLPGHAATTSPLPPTAPEPDGPEPERPGWRPGGIGECAVCHGSMYIYEPGQTTHPNCDPG